MGDGCVNKQAKNPHIMCGMVSQNYLKYIDNIFGCLGNGVSLHKTAKESAKQCKNRGFSPNAKEENYSDIYQWRSRSHPKLQKFADWYSTGKKVWPKDIKLTPTVLKHWYCGDGHWKNKDGDNYIIISMSNEVENQHKIDKMFENVGLPTPSNYNISKQQKSNNKKCDAKWTVDQSKELWDYMGKPLPDFYYKWPEQYH